VVGYPYIYTYTRGVPTPHQFHTLHHFTPVLPLFSFLSFTTLYIAYGVVIHVSRIVLPLLDNVAHSIFCDTNKIRTNIIRTECVCMVVLVTRAVLNHLHYITLIQSIQYSYIHITSSLLLQAHIQSYIRL
jgi:hypothetical protein